MTGLPFDESLSSKGVRIRTFQRDTDPEELVWHRDVEDRQVSIIAAEGWYLQLDEQLPVELTPGDSHFIPRGMWHRVISRGSSNLIVEIR